MILFWFFAVNEIVRTSPGEPFEGVVIDFGEMLVEAEQELEAEQEKYEQEQEALTSKAADQAAAKNELTADDIKSFDERASEELANEIKQIEDGMAEELAEKKDADDLDVPTDEMIEPIEDESTESEQLPFTGKTRVSFYLPNRKRLKLPTPVYTCQEGGKIVVDVTVEAGGRVIKATINKAESDKGKPCLEKSGKRYAQRSTFDKIAGRGTQQGTITYIFAKQ